MCCSDWTEADGLSGRMYRQSRRSSVVVGRLVPMLARSIVPVMRTAVSYLPSDSLLLLRSASDLPRRLRGHPHEDDFWLLGDLGLNGATILDVGANRGQSIASIRTAVASPVLHAVEPNPWLAAYLRGRRDASVTVHEVALGDRTGTLTLHIPRYGNTLWDTRASLSPDEPIAFLSADYFWRYNRQRCSVEVAEVHVRTLDSLGIRPAFIKIDVEGFDHAVVSGGMETIAGSLPVILIEEPHKDTVNMLEALGYRPYCYDHATRSLSWPHSAALNTFFLTDEAVERHGLESKLI